VVPCGELPAGTSVPDWAESTFAAASARPADLPGLRRVIGVVQVERSKRWVQISQDGTVWVIEMGEDGGLRSARLSGLWKEMPGFVSDFAFVKRPQTEGWESGSSDYREEESRRIYVSTDGGVYLLEFDWENKRGHAHRIDLPGVGRMCMAITHYADDRYGYLWVSDTAGDAHLFWADHVASPELPYWQRSAIRHDATQVILAFSSWRTLAGHLVVGQARRNDVIVISRYVSRDEKRSSDKAEPSVRLLLQDGTAADLRRFIQSLDPDAETWEPEALLADFFEYLGEDEDRMKSLREFLRSPNARLAGDVLKQVRNPEGPGEAVALWTDALLRTLHRYNGTASEMESLYVGVVRWLRTLSEVELGAEPKQRVAETIETQIAFTRKWGLFGDTYTQRHSAAVPWKVLVEQQKPDLLDRYAYQSLLFQRQVDLEHENNRGRKLGRTAWDLRTLTAGDKLLVAVSWIWGGIELYQVCESTDRPEGYELDLCVVFRPEKEEAEGLYRSIASNIKQDADPPKYEDLDYGHCRALVLGTLPGEQGHYLLASPAQPPGRSRDTRFELWRLHFDKDGRVQVVDNGHARIETSLAPTSKDEKEEESVYSLLEVEPGVILAGLRGYRGIAQVALVKIEGPALRLACLPPQKLTSESPAGKSIARNNVWVLAQERDRPHVIFAGCGDGQVWRLTVSGAAQPAIESTRVGRIGAPVWALACQTSATASSTVLRVFAGGADGTIFAWQQTAGDEFTPVWATWEGDGPIARIHPLGKDERFPMVLAVTQQGRAVLFADRAQVEGTDRSSRHKRLKIPGERYGRPSLQASAFASELVSIPKPLLGNESERPLARLLSATKDGRIQVHTFRHPLRLPERREQYKKLVATWLSMVCGPQPYETYRRHRLRVAEAAYLASPVAPQVLVRGLLEHSEHSESSEPWPSWSALHRQ